jgi:hypothetical protein
MGSGRTAVNTQERSVGAETAAPTLSEPESTVSGRPWTSITPSSTDRPQLMQRFTLQIGSLKVTSVSSSNPTRIRGLRADLRDHRRHAAGIPDAPAVVGEQ